MPETEVSEKGRIAERAERAERDQRDQRVQRAHRDQRAQRDQRAHRAHRDQRDQRARAKTAMALLNLKNFLIENRTTLYETNPRGLDELERGFMSLMRATLGPSVRLIGVPLGVRDWQTYVRLYCAYLVAAGKLSPPCTIFVSLPGPEAPEATESTEAPEPQDELRVCLLREDSIGRLRVLC